LLCCGPETILTITAINRKILTCLFL